MTVFLLAALILSLVGITIYTGNLRRSMEAAPKVLTGSPPALIPESAEMPRVSVIIPAYNEADNILECVTAVLNSTPLSADTLEVLVVDDQSNDDTLAIAQNLQNQTGDRRLKILRGEPRPANQTWVGKNWACTQAATLATGEFLLFIDADVRLKPKAIETTVLSALRERIDLLTCAPALVCECFAEWLVQPVMMNHLLVCFDVGAVNDPTSETAFGSGPFMLFRGSAYEQIGGHRSVASEVVEDVQLAKRIKRAGLKLRYVLAPDLATVRMYRSLGQLWEGWTKNLYLGGNRSLWLMIYLALIMLVIYPLPWLGLVILLGKSFVSGLQTPDFLAIALALTVIWRQYELRRLGAPAGHIGQRYWWLSGVGGIIVAAAALASAIKTETGWGWTWRGRELKLSPHR